MLSALFWRSTMQHVLPHIANCAEHSSAIWIRLLGSFRLFKDGQPTSIAPGSKTEALLSTLAVHYTDGVSRDSLLSLLWPNQEPVLATQSLNSLVHSLRRVLEPALEGAPPLLYSGGYYQLNFEAGIRLDLARFETLAQEGD